MAAKSMFETLSFIGEHGMAGEAVRARPPAVDASTDAVAFARAVVAACLAQVLPNAAAVAGAVASGNDDAELIHQLRVGLRRLRTAISELAEFNAGLDPGWEAPLAEAFRALGVARDGQMLASAGFRDELIAAGAPALPVPALLHPPALHPPAVRLSLQRAEFQRTLLAAMAFACGAADGSAFDGTPLEALADRLDHLHERIRHSASRFAAMPVEEQHRVRKRLKRLRYLAEFVGPLFKRSRVDAFLDALKPAQDALGRHNDEHVALQACRAAASAASAASSDAAGGWFAVGWLTARQQASAKNAAKALKAAGRAERFWHGRPKKPGHTVDPGIPGDQSR